MPTEPPAPTPELLGAACLREGDPRAGLPADEPGRRILLRFLLRLAGVLALLAAGDLVLRRLLPDAALLPWMEREFAAYTVKVERARTGPAPELLVLGNSRVHDGVVPEALGQALSARLGRPARVFNLGLMNAKVAEWSALVRDHLPDPPPARVVIGLSGTEAVHEHEFQYASRFLWSAREAADWLARTPPARLEVAQLGHWIESLLGRAWHAFALRDALRLRADERLEDLAHQAFGTPRALKARAVRVQVGRYNLADALAPGGRLQDPGPQPSLAGLLAAGGGVRIPPYSLADPAPLVRGDDFPLLRDVVTRLRARGCRVALFEMPPSPWLQAQCPEFHGDLFRLRMADFARTLDLPFVPMPPGETLLDDGSYVDANHLSQAGALRFTRLLAERLAATGFLDG